jgi:chromosome segregation ATPase
METEKTIMLWEKKLQLAREMKEALDPSYGASELRTMEKEVSRMELRLSQIKKQQEVIVQEMGHALQRRETIATQGKVQQRLNKDKTRADVAKGITELRREVKRLHDETDKHDLAMRDSEETQRNLETEIEQLQHIARETRNKKTEVETQMRAEEKTKITSQSKLEKLQGKNRLFQGQKTILKSVEGFDSAFGNLKNQEGQLISLIEMLAGDFPHLADNLLLIKDRVFAV